MGLDPDLFIGERLRPDVRQELVGMALGFLGQRYQGADYWLHAWLAGGSASHRWHPEPGGLKDLDVLLSVDFNKFRSSNRDFTGVGDREIAQHLNEELREGLWRKGWHDHFDLTFYVNRALDIRDIKPYAAYDLMADDWTVKPSATPSIIPKEWDQFVDLYQRRAQRATSAYAQALTELQGATIPAHKIDAARRFHFAVDEATTLFENVHDARHLAFSPTGGGGDDFYQYLWKQGKSAGWIPALREIKEYRDSVRKTQAVETYGTDLPDPDVLVRRAVLQYRTP